MGQTSYWTDEEASMKAVVYKRYKDDVDFVFHWQADVVVGEEDEGDVLVKGVSNLLNTNRNILFGVVGIVDKRSCVDGRGFVLMRLV